MRMYRTPVPDTFIAITPFNRRGFVRSPSADKLIFEAIETIAEIFQPVGNWILGGGVAIALHAGRFHRSHHDLDLLVPADSLAQLLSIARLSGYEPYTEYQRFTIPPAAVLRLLRRIPVEEKAPRTFIKLYRRGADQANRFLSMLDLTVFAETNHETMRADGKVKLPASEFAPVPYTTSSGTSIHLASLEYLKRAKARRRHPVDRRDCAIVERLIVLGKKEHSPPGTL